jgi:prepilin-type processing-associated H-X9-DG protein
MAGVWKGVRWRAFAGVVAALAGAVVLVQLAGGPARSAGDKDALPADLQRIPTDSAAFVSVRPGDLWGTEPAQRLREQFKEHLPQGLDEWRKFVGLPPQDIERLTAVYVSFPPGDLPLFFVAAAQPLDRTKVLANVGPDAKEEKRKEHTLYVGPRNNAVHFIDDHSYIAGKVEAVRDFLERPAPKKEGPLGPALRLAEAKHTLVAGVNPEPVVAQVPEELPPMAEPYKPLLKARLATLAVDLGKETRGDLRLTFAEEKEAQQAEKAVKAGLSMARVGLGLAAQQVQKDKEAAKLAELIGHAQADLEDSTVKQEGPAVEVRVAIKADLTAAGYAINQAVLKTRQASTRIQSQNNLKQIALAMLNYTSTNGHFPAQAVYSPDGKPLLSWRVLILPYVEQDALYKEFHLDEPWDSDHNKKLLAKMPKLYALPGKDAEGTTDTYYLGFAGKRAFFDGRKGVAIQDITDGTSNTIMVVEAAKGVPWTKPEDLPFDPEKPLPKMATHWAGGFNVAFCDGSVHFLSPNIKPAKMKAFITRNGGEVVPLDSDE